MKWKPYPKYKPSGVEWLGELPEHWEVKRLGFVVLKVGSGKTPRGGAQSYQTEGVMLIRSQNVYDDGLRLDDVVFIDEETDEQMAGSRVNPKDVLLNITGASLGRCSVVPSSFPKANVNQHVCIVRSEHQKIFPAFAQRSLIAQSVKAQIFAGEEGSSREGLNFQQVRNLTITLPPLPEQTAIAAFLDRETGRIDELVGKKRELIERLKEKRSALISRTVTRGLPADIPPETLAKLEKIAGEKLPLNPPLKPSGIDWLGDVPEHWEVKRLSYLASLQSGENITSEMIAEGGEYPVYGGNGYRGNYHRFTHRGHYVLIGRQGALCGNINYAHNKFWASEHALVVTPLVRFEVIWLGELLRAMNLGQYSVTAAQPGISAEAIRALRIPVPPVPEQAAIAAYLEEETAKLDALITNVETAIERLLEYRNALITAAVTGKFDLRGKE